MKCVYSYWNRDGYDNTSGFNTFEDFLVSISLTSLNSKKFFDEVELVTNHFGNEVLIRMLKLPFTSVRTDLSQFDTTLNKMWWAYTKLYAYSVQDKPFVHLDNDCFIWKGLPDRIKTKQLFFQSIETPFNDWYAWYKPLLEVAATNPAFPDIIKNNPVDCAFNCGIVGGNDTEIIKEWIKLSTYFTQHPNNDKFYKKKNSMVIHQNLLHEQYFISSLAKQKGYKLNEDVGFLLRNTHMQQDCQTEGFTHLWGTVKREKHIVEKIHNRLKKDYPEYYWRIKDMKLNEK